MRVALFFDGSNFYHSMRSEDLRIDYDRLARFLVTSVAGTHLARAEYHVSVPLATPSTMDNFLRGLSMRAGFFVYRYPRVTRSAKCRACDAGVVYTLEKQVDTSITASMIKLAAVNAYDIAVVVSGDQDFIPGIIAVGDLGKTVYVATWSHEELSIQMRQHCYGHIVIKEHVDEFRAMDNRLSVPIVSVDGS